MKIIFMGTPEFAVPSLEMLIKNGYEIVCVVTQPDRPQGRKNKLVAPIVKKVAEKHNIPVFQPEKLRNEIDYLLDLDADLIITAAYGQILPKKLLDAIPAINVHGSLLPAYRGGAPIQYALFDGLEKTGVTIMDMAYKMDSGDIILQEAIEIKDEDTYGTLSEKLSVLGARLLKDVLENDYERIKQDESKVTFAYTLKREDEYLDFYDTASNVINRLRGLLPEPGATFFINDNTFKVYNAKKSDIIKDRKPGEVVLTKKKMFIQTKTEAVEILEIQAPGKRRMRTIDFLNGQRIIEDGDYVERR